MRELSTAAANKRNPNVRYALLACRLWTKESSSTVIDKLIKHIGHQKLSNLKISFKSKPTSLGKQRLPQITDLTDARWDVVDSEIFHRDAAFQFSPLDGG